MAATQSRVDHVVFACEDCEAAAKLMYEVLACLTAPASPHTPLEQLAPTQKHGLKAYQGGRHEALGSENWLVPLGGAYLELLAIFDADVAKRTPWGRMILAQLERAGSKPWVPVAWAVQLAEGTEEACRRLGEQSQALTRTLPDGGTVSCRYGCVMRIAEADGPHKPFFIVWDDPSKRPDKVSLLRRLVFARLRLPDAGCCRQRCIIKWSRRVSPFLTCQGTRRPCVTGLAPQARICCHCCAGQRVVRACTLWA